MTMDMNLSKLREAVEDRGAWLCQTRLRKANSTSSNNQ